MSSSKGSSRFLPSASSFLVQLCLARALLPSTFFMSTWFSLVFSSLRVVYSFGSWKSDLFRVESLSIPLAQKLASKSTWSADRSSEHRDLSPGNLPEQMPEAFLGLDDLVSLLWLDNIGEKTSAWSLLLLGISRVSPETWKLPTLVHLAFVEHFFYNLLKLKLLLKISCNRKLLI